MKRVILFATVIVFLLACNNKKAPDVSNIPVNLDVQHFENDFFKIDTNNLAASLQQLSVKYPQFLHDYLINILGLPPVNDSSGQVEMAIRKFIQDYNPVKDSAEKLFRNFDKTEEDIRNGLQYVKYYFPQYKLPSKIITFIGPLDAYFEGSLGGYGDVITTNALAIGLQLHLGSHFSLYTTETGQMLYPKYISQRFTPAYIPVNCIKNIIDDLFPDKSGGKPLVIQMVEKGKRLYLLDKLLPYTPDTLKIGYTGNQLKGCYHNEGLIWNYFLTNGLVYSNDPEQIKGYIGDAPNTPEFGDGAPGYIGLFVGWQIVKKFMDEHPELSLTQLMHTDPKTVFEKSNYKPK